MKRGVELEPGFKKTTLTPIKRKRSVNVTSPIKTQATPEDIGFSDRRPAKSTWDRNACPEENSTRTSLHASSTSEPSTTKTLAGAEEN